MVANLVPVDKEIQFCLNQRLEALESYLNADVISFTGTLDGNEMTFAQLIEDIKTDGKTHDTLFVLLTTPGGRAESVERHVNILRKHYAVVNFIVPDHAYSAGTIFCMSGNAIYMDYISVLGPIDPQIRNKDGNYVPALGYLDKVKELVGKAESGTLTQAEFLILKDLDLAELRAYEQAKELTIDLLQEWLVKYKFKDWSIHRTTEGIIGQEVTMQEKEARATEIANKLSDNTIWKSHGRPINIEALEKELKLKIEDYSEKLDLREKIKNYYLLLNDYISRNRLSLFVHTRRFI
jgi:membrane-bound ClpP family serine protease